ncbi:MAG: hypothetical protein M5U01_30210 [Ardenticatenaceae bacterium]|nr:hypothetical protein [Ardenticatenaceae bacterium]
MAARDRPTGLARNEVGCYSAMLEKRLHHPAIEVRASVVANVREDSLLRPGGAVGAVGAQRVPNVHHREDPRRKRNLLTLQAAGVARPVPLFVMAVGNVERGA